jgi:protein-S-isoprenylcysteine O-methyltransferase Ste14
MPDTLRRPAAAAKTVAILVPALPAGGGTMALVAMLLYVLGLLFAVGVRSAVQWWRTGDTGFRLDAGPVGSAAWWAKVLLVASIAGGVAGPTAALAGLPPLAFLDHAALRVTGVAVAAAGLAGTLFVQFAMGPSWRIGVDPAERTALVTRGAFAVVRNPIFTTMAATSVGMALMVPNPVSLAATALLVLSVEVQVRAVEEPHLLRVHGRDYIAYAGRVGRFLPGLGFIRGRLAGDIQSRP